MRNCKLSEQDQQILDKLKREKAEKGIITDTERLFVIKSNPALLAEVDGVILRNRLHNAIMDLVTDSIESGKVQVESVEDIEMLLYLELLLI